AGTYAQIVGRDGEYVILRLNSAEQRMVHGRCMATIGAVSNPDNMNVSIGKAGRKRWMGRMPHNRGVSMNPIDHPHGGGGGRPAGATPPGTPGGSPNQGKETRQKKPHNKIHRRGPPRGKKEDGAAIRARSFGKGRFVDAYLQKRGGAPRSWGPHEMIRI